MNKIKVKVIVAGDAAVGKTTLLQTFVNNNYPKDYAMTQGVDILSKIMPIENSEKEAEFFFFDTAGHPLYKSIVGDAYKDTHFAMLFYDITSKSSFTSLQGIYDELKKANGGKDIPGVVVATKIDMKPLREVEFATGSDFAKQNKMEFSEVSAARNMDVEQPFKLLLEKLLSSKW